MKRSSGRALWLGGIFVSLWVWLLGEYLYFWSMSSGVKGAGCWVDNDKRWRHRASPSMSSGLFVIFHPLIEMPASSCSSFLFWFQRLLSGLITSSGVKGHVSHRGISTAHVPPFLFFLTQRWCHKQGLPEHRVHSQRPVSSTGLSSKQAVSMATAASGHVSAFHDVVVLQECEDARVCTSRTRVPV